MEEAVADIVPGEAPEPESQQDAPLHPGVDTPAVRGGGVGFGGAHLAGVQQSAEPGEEPVVGLPGDRPHKGLVDAFGDHGPVLVHSASGEGTSPNSRSTVRIRRWLVSAIVVSGRRQRASNRPIAAMAYLIGPGLVS